MKELSLCGIWKMRGVGDGAWLEAEVPGSVASTLLAHGLIPDPYVQDNEEKVLPIFERDYEFVREFTITPETLSHDRVALRCDGLDTLCDLTLNGVHLGHCDNMHRTWRFEVKDLLRPGENRLEIRFQSASAYVKAHPSQVGKPFSVIRKAACMFGWDWGLNLPDMGIWRDIYLESFDCARIEHVQVDQKHGPDGVALTIKAEPEAWGDIQLSVRVTDPDGRVIFDGRPDEEGVCAVPVAKPRLWQPVGYGAQPLYRVSVTARHGKTVLDCRGVDVGLRTIRLDRTREGDGSRYSFIVNGTPVFLRGESLIITDAILSRFGEEQWRRLIDNCLASNLNCIRVWGGAVYPPDLFYELCDRAGLLVYQDFMFACSFYQISPEFMENVRAEAEDNLRRIASHPCVAVFCGNNEVDGIYTVSGSTEPETVALRQLFGSGDALPQPVRDKLWAMYEPLFCGLLPGLCSKYAPDTAYVSSSPCGSVPGKAESFFEYMRDGDMHYYLQYNGNAPYQRMREFRCRFMTELGFQSYPSVKTIASFADEDSRSPYSPVMYAHQKCFKGNETIELYMERDYFVPRAFEDYVYLSQLQAGEILRYSVEHFRRDSEYCRGVILWQLNDCWPVVSWSGIDSLGRWKAQQYYMKRFYAPVLLSVREDGSQAELWLSNDTPSDFAGTAWWRLCDPQGQAVRQGSLPVNVPAGRSSRLETLDLPLAPEQLTNHVLCCRLEQGGVTLSRGSTLLCLAKEFDWQEPSVEVQVKEQGNRYTITVSADCYAKGVCLDTAAGDCVFSDNYFDLIPGESVEITVSKKDAVSIASVENLRAQLTVTTLNQVLLRAKGAR